MFIKEEFEDTRGVIRICKSKKDRQHNGQKKRYKGTNNDLQNTTEKKKHRATPHGSERRCSSHNPTEVNAGALVITPRK